MHLRSLTLLAVSFTLLASCSTIPRPVSSTHYKSVIAGFGWKIDKGFLDSKANAGLGVQRLSSSPSRLYLKAYLPNPDGSLSSPIKKIDSGGKGSFVMFEGADKEGWIHNRRYTFYLEIFSDPEYQNKIDSLSQPAVCIIPPLPKKN